MEFILKTLTVMGGIYLLMFGVIAFFLKGIYENTNIMNTNNVRVTERSSSNTKRIDKLDADTIEMSRSLHDFKNDIGARVGTLEYRITEKRQ